MEPSDHGTTESDRNRTTAASGSQQFRANRLRFNDDQVVAAYERLSGLMADEEVLIGRFMPNGARVLDLGVGTGRTSRALAERSSLYVGLDYAEQMVEAARRRNPGLDLRVGDATDLGDFADRSFEVVVFSYNGIDYLHPDASRGQSLREIKRVLEPGGVLLLARHNPRSVVARAEGCGRLPKRLAVSGYASLRRAVRLIPTRAFWRGEGYVREPYKGVAWSSTWRHPLCPRGAGAVRLSAPIDPRLPRDTPDARLLDTLVLVRIRCRVTLVSARSPS